MKIKKLELMVNNLSSRFDELRGSILDFDTVENCRI